MGLSYLPDVIEVGRAQEPALHLDRAHARDLWRFRRDESSEKCPNSSAELYSTSISMNLFIWRRFIHAAMARVSFCVLASWAATKAVRMVRPDSVMR